MSGSAFWFTLPYRPDPVAAAHANDVGEVGTRGESAGAGLRTLNLPSAMAPLTRLYARRVVLVDGEQATLRGVGRLLRVRGHTVTTAVNGAQGLECLQAAYLARAVDCVVTDAMLPVMDGWDMVARFRAWEGARQRQLAAAGLAPLPRVVIVATSATDDQDTRAGMLDAGADFFLPKVRRSRDRSVAGARRLVQPSSYGHNTRTPACCPVNSENALLAVFFVFFAS